MELLRDDLHYILTRLPRGLRELLQTEAIRGLCLGGGCIRDMITGAKVNDYDLFGPSVGAVQRAAEVLQLQRGARIYKTDNALTVLSPPRTPVQFITRWTYDHPTQVVQSFDFTVCQAVIWFDLTGTWRSLVSPEFYPDLAARRLRYTFPRRNEDAGGSMLRVVKYLARGYRISPESLAGVMGRLCSRVDWMRLSGVEEEITKVITGLLREVDPLSVIDGMEVVDDAD